MKKQYFMKMAAVVLLAGLTACTKENNGVLLEGNVVGATVEDGLVTYMPDGNPFNYQATEFEVGEDGTFTYDTELVEETGDVTVEMSGVGYFGVHLVKGETVKMTVEKEGDTYQARFDGPQSDVSRFVNEYTQRMDQMLYWSPDPEESKPIAEYRQLLDDNYNKVKAALEGIEDSDTRDYYARLTDSQYKWLAIRIIMDSCENDNSNYKLNAEYQELVKDIDVNDPVNLRTNMAYTALNSLNTVSDKDVYGSCLRQMELTDSLITNPATRRMMVQMVGQATTRT